jgi:hypothetical protein
MLIKEVLKMNINIKTTLILLILISTAFAVSSMTTMTSSTGEQTISCENNKLIKFIVNQDLIPFFSENDDKEIRLFADCETICNSQGCYEFCP